MPGLTDPARTNTAIRFDQDVMDRLRAAAADHHVPINWLVNKACADFLDHLLPASEVVWTRPTTGRALDIAHPENPHV